MAQPVEPNKNGRHESLAVAIFVAMAGDQNQRGYNADHLADQAINYSKAFWETWDKKLKAAQRQENS